MLNLSSKISCDPCKLMDDVLVFPANTEERIEKRGRSRKVSNQSILRSLVFHSFMGNNTGSLSEHMKQLEELTLSDSSISQRRKMIPQQIFEELCDLSLKPISQRDKHSGSFYKGMLLLGIDGSEFKL